MDFIEILYFVNALILGVFVGAQICEGALMVPQWKSLPPSEFYKLHKGFGPKIYQFFAPLTIAATVIPIGTAMLAWNFHSPGHFYVMVAAIFALMTLSTFYLFFKKTNKGFANGSFSDKQLPAELVRWEKWHWTRVGFELISFACALLAISAN